MMYVDTSYKPIVIHAYLSATDNTLSCSQMHYGRPWSVRDRYKII